MMIKLAWNWTMLEQYYNLSFEIIRPSSLQIQTFKIRLTTHEMSDEIQNQQKKCRDS